jgi:hypothetical protein
MLHCNIAGANYIAARKETFREQAVDPFRCRFRHRDGGLRRLRREYRPADERDRRANRSRRSPGVAAGLLNRLIAR